MPQKDQWGGIAIDDDSVDAYGGVLVEEESTPPEPAPSFTPPPATFTLGGKEYPIPDQSTRPPMPRSVSSFAGVAPETARAQDLRETLPAPREFVHEVMEPFSVPISKIGEDEIQRGMFGRTLPESYELLIGGGDTPGTTAKIASGLTKAGLGLGETLVSPLAIASGGASVLPKVAQRLVSMGFAADMLSQFPEQVRAFAEATETGDPEQITKTLGDLSVATGFTAGAGFHALRPTPAPIPDPVRQVIERTAQDLPKSAAAVTKAVTRERPIEKGMTDAETIRSDPGQVRETGRQPEVVQDQGRENIQQPAPEQPQPARAQGSAETPLLLAERVAAMTPDEFVQAARSEFQEGGFTTHALNMGREMATPEGIAALRKLEAQAKAEADAAMAAENFDALGALTSQKQFFSEALETATGASEFKNSDPAKFRQMMEAGKQSEPSAVVETQPASAFFERESEAAGLGRSSLPPTVETVRQQRATEAQQLAAEQPYRETDYRGKVAWNPPVEQAAQRAREAAIESGFVPESRAAIPIAEPTPIAPGNKRSQVFGREGVGHEYTPESMAGARERVKAQVFDADRPITEATTAEAIKLIEDWTSKESGGATGDRIRQAGESTLAYGAAQQELFNYALKLASTGKPEMLNRLVQDINRMSTPGVDTISEAGRALSGRSDFENPLWNAYREVAKEGKNFTPEQHQRLAKLNETMADPNLDAHQKVKANNEILDITRRAKLPPTAMHAIAEGYAASMFSGVPTVAVNTFAPPLLMARNLFTELATNPRNFPSALKQFGEAMKSFKPEFEWSWLNDSYSMHTAEYLKQSGALKQMMENGLKDMRDGHKAQGAAKVFYGAQQFVFRTLSSLDQAWRTVEREYKTALFSSKALKDAGYSREAIAQLSDGAVALKRLAYEDAIARGLSEQDARVRSHDAVLDAWWDGLSERTKPSKATDVAKSARREADLVAGLKSEGLKETSEGMLSQPINKFMEYFSSGLTDPSPYVRIGTRMMFGVVNVPFRTLRSGANFSPYGLVRYAVHKGRTGAGKETLWKQSYGNEAQARQRLNEALAGTAVMMLLPVLTSSTAEDDDKKQFGVFVTGKGPDASDRIVRDAWLKKYRPYSIIVKSGDKYGVMPLSRGGESVLWATAMAGALDDYYLRAKHNVGVRQPKDLSETAEVAGSYFQSMAQRGIFSTFSRLGELGSPRSGKPLSGAASAAAYTAGPLVPYKGAMDSFTRVLSDPVDKSSISGALLANTPVAGGVFGQPAVNALGDPIDDRTPFGKAIREGSPVAIKVQNPQSPAYQLILKHGQGPTTPTRGQTEAVYGTLSNQQWYELSKQAGRAVKAFMEKEAQWLNGLNAKDFNDAMTRISTDARANAAVDMGLAPREPTP